MRKNDWILLSGLTFIMGLLFIHRSLNPEQIAVQTPQVATPAPIAVNAGFIAAPTQVKRTLAATAVNTERAWNKFKDKYGGNLQPGYMNHGLISTIQGSLESKPASGRFNASDSQQAIARSKEVLGDVQDLIGYKITQPLTNPVYRGSDQYAEVSFQEQIQGIPIEPFGTITVSLGPEGELKSLYSTYVADINVPNIDTAKLSQDTGRARAIASVTDASPQSRASAGTVVIWATPPSSPNGTPQGRAAYSYYVEGRQVVVDASSGEVIFRRDKRQF